MGLKKSKPRRHTQGDRDGEDQVKAFSGRQSVEEHSAAHADSVTCVAPFSAGVCLSGSADKVRILILILACGVMPCGFE